MCRGVKKSTKRAQRLPKCAQCEHGRRKGRVQGLRHGLLQTRASEEGRASARTDSSPPPPCPPARVLPPPPPPRRAGWSPLGGAGFALGGMCCVLQSLQWPLWRPCSVLAVVCAVVLAPPLLLAPVLALSALRQPPPTPPPRRCPPDWSPLGGAGLRWVACAAFSSSTVPAVAPLASMLAVARAGGGGLSPMRLCT
jgi:hypothetical protein